MNFRNIVTVATAVLLLTTAANDTLQSSGGHPARPVSFCDLLIACEHVSGNSPCGV